MEPQELLIVWHSRTGASEAMAKAAFCGAGSCARLVPADQVQPADLLAAAGYLFVCPENLASMSRSEEHTSELQSLMRISYAVFCLKKKKTTNTTIITKTQN